MTEHPLEAADESGIAPIDVEELHKLVLQSLDDDWGAGVGGCFSGTFGQGVSWRTGAAPTAHGEARALGIGDTSWGVAREWRLQRSDRGAGEGK